MKRDFVKGDWHTMQCADDVLLSCTLETCIPINSIQIIIKERKNIKCLQRCEVGTLLQCCRNAK